MTIRKEIIIATRKSKLALIQTNQVKEALQKVLPETSIKILEITSSGDKQTDTALTDIGGKYLFVRELQRAVLEKRADLAVHSLKDLGAVPPPGLTIAAVCKREDPRDVFVSNTYNNFSSLPKGAIVGTASPRRQSQLLALRPDLKITLLRGNVETRLKKLNNGEYDAIVLAAAGLNRLNLSHVIKVYFNPQRFIPAIGQGAIAIESRDNDIALHAKLISLNHVPTEICTAVERAVNAELKGSCFSPLGAFATLHKSHLYLTAMVGSPDGSVILKAAADGPLESVKTISSHAAASLLYQGARQFLQTD